MTVNMAMPIGSLRRRKVREDDDEGERNQYAACETLQDAKEDHQIQRMRLSAANREEDE